MAAVRSVQDGQTACATATTAATLMWQFVLTAGGHDGVPPWSEAPMAPMTANLQRRLPDDGLTKELLFGGARGMAWLWPWPCGCGGGSRSLGRQRHMSPGTRMWRQRTSPKSAAPASPDGCSRSDQRRLAARRHLHGLTRRIARGAGSHRRADRTGDKGRRILAVDRRRRRPTRGAKRGRAGSAAYLMVGRARVRASPVF